MPGLVRTGLLAAVLAMAVLLTACGGDDGSAGLPTTTDVAVAQPLATTSSSPPVPASSQPAVELCLGVEVAEDPPVVQVDALTEVSGVAVSRQHDELLWLHNDSGGDPVVYGVGADGAAVAELLLEGAESKDT